MALISGILQPHEVDGTTFSVAAATASPLQTAFNNALLYISNNGAFSTTGGTGVTVTFGSSTGKAPTVPSATNGFLIPPGQAIQFYLGANRDSFRVFNLDAANAVKVSFQAMSV